MILTTANLSTRDMEMLREHVRATAKETIRDDARLIDGIRSPVARAALWRASANASAGTGLEAIAKPPEGQPLVGVMLGASHAIAEGEAWARCVAALLEALR